MDEYLQYKNILCIDLKSFYASVECVERGLDPFKTPLVVADKTRGDGSIVLAVTPYLKKQGVPSRCRLFELPKNKNIIYAPPRMRRYLEVSADIVSIYLDYVSEEDLHIYSIDEVFLDVTSYLKYHKKSDYELAETILDDIFSKTGIPATCGIGPNMLLAKIALDIESKKNKNGIAKWTYDDVESKLWNIKPLSEMWGIGKRMEANLNKMGIFSVYDLANYDKDKLISEFGVIGEELFYHANGIDLSVISNNTYVSKRKSFGLGQTLFKDYDGHSIMCVIRDMVDIVCMRLRSAKKKAQVVHLSIGYSRSVGGGFGRQLKLDNYTNSNNEVYDACIFLFKKYYDGSPIRRVSISLSKLIEKSNIQLNLFENPDKMIKLEKLDSTVDNIKLKHGNNSILRASSYTENSTVRFRNSLIGGHKA